MTAPAIPNAQSPLGIVLINPTSGLPYSAAPNLLTPYGSTRTALFGDSFLKNGYGVGTGATVGGSFVVTSGIVTMNFTGNSFAAVGNYYILSNLGDVNAANVLNGAMVKILTTPSTTQCTFSATWAGNTLADGDYSTIASVGWLLASAFFTTDSFFNTMNYALGSPFNVTLPYCMGGATSVWTQTVLNRALTTGTPSFDVGVICCGTNDLSAVATGTAAGIITVANTVFATISAMVNALLARNIPVILCPQPMRSGTFTTQQQLDLNRGMMYLRRLLLNTFMLDTAIGASNAAKVKVIDLAKFLSDGTNTTTGGYVGGTTTYSDDGLHPTAQGGLALANMQGSQSFSLVNLFERDVNTEVIWAGDDFNNTNDPQNNIIASPGMQGTAGTFGTSTGNVTPSGTVATNWQVVANANGAAAGMAAVCTGQAARLALEYTNAVNWGFMQELNITWTLAGQTVNLQTAAGSGALTSRIVPNNWYQIGYTVQAVGNCTGLAGVTAQLLMNPIRALSLNFVSGHNNGLPLAANQSQIIVSAPFFIPPTTITLGELLIIAQASGVGTSQIRIGNVFMRQVASPYTLQ